MQAAGPRHEQRLVGEDPAAAGDLRVVLVQARLARLRRSALACLKLAALDNLTAPVVPGLRAWALGHTACTVSVGCASMAGLQCSLLQDPAA